MAQDDFYPSLTASQSPDEKGDPFLLDDTIPFLMEMQRELAADLLKNGNAWSQRPVYADGVHEHQNTCFYTLFTEYYARWRRTGVDIPWVKIACEALLCWVRVKYFCKVANNGNRR